MKKFLSILLAVVLMITPMTGLQESYAISFDFIYAYEDNTVSPSETFDLPVRLTSCNATLNSLTLVNVKSSLSGFTIKGVKAGELVQASSISYESDFDSITLSNINVSYTGTLIYITVQAPAKAGSYEIYPQAGDQTYNNASYFGTYYEASSIITVKEDTSTTTKKTVTFNANSGAGGPGSLSAEAGQTVTIPNDAPTKSGYLFQGWTENSQSSEVTYRAGSTITLDRDYVLYAVWKADDRATLYYDANGKTLTSGLPDSSSFIKGATIAISSVKPATSGYSFVGWSTNASATTATYLPGNSYSFSGDTTLYAIWKQITYTISYDANGGNGAPDSQTKTPDVDITISSTKPTRDGYSFAGWSVSKSAVSADYVAGDKYSKNEPLTLYAVWVDKTYVVTYKANGGKNAPAEQTKVYNQNLIITTSAPNREGYKFVGWSTNSAAASAEYVGGSVYQTNAPLTLYAVWELEKYTLTFDANGGENAPASQIKTFGSDISITTSVPSREGYLFQGWSESKDGEVHYKSGDAFGRNGDTTLYAVWKIKTYKVSYDANGGENAPDTQTKTYGKDLTLRAAKPTREGYTFLGWSEAKTGEALYTASASFTKNADTTLYAIWQKKTYTVTFNANGGTNAPAAQTKTYGVELVLSTKTPTKTGYQFAGWAKTKTADTAEYAAGDKYATDANVTLYAVWAINVFNVTFDANGGEKAPAAQTKIYGKNLTLSASVPVRTGYDFKGWSTSATGSVAYAAGAAYTKNADITLYAVWKIKTYKVSYDANGGENAPDAQTKTYGKDLTLKSAKPTREGYIFLGWSESKTGDAQYSAGATFTKNADTILYAVWQKKTYTVTFNANGGTNAPAAQTKTYGDALVLSTKIPTKTGYQFAGWANTKTADAPDYAAGDTYVTNANVTLYAVWAINVFTVTYDANGGEKAPAAQKKIYGKELSLSANVPVRTGYDFKGWSTSATGKVVYTAGAAYTKNSDITLYAVWKIKTYKVSYDANGGENPPATQTKTYGKDLTLKSAKPTREGYIFQGWSDSKNGEVLYKAGATYSANAEVTLYAVWKIRTYSVKYNANGGKEAPSSQIKTYGVTLSITDSIPTRTGYVFKGWTSDSTSTKVEYKPADKYVTNASIVLYAVWEKKIYTISYDANGGTNAPKAQEKTYGESITLSADVPARVGYIFLGWSVTENGKVNYKAGATLSRNSNTVLYAVWEAEKYTIVFKGNGTVCGINDQIKTYGQTLILTSETPNRPGYVFTGWSTDKTAKSPEYLPGDKFNLEKDTSLYAIWATEVFTISFDGNGGVCNISPLVKIKGEDLIIDSGKTGVPTRTGYFCVGWSASKDATDPEYSVVIPETFTTDADCTLYAVWIENPFTDVTKNNWSQKYIGYVYYRKAMKGRQADYFAGGELLRRDETVTLLYQSEGKPTPESENSVFTDVTGGFALKSIIWAYENNIVTGYGDGTFNPTAPIERQQFIKILYEYAKYKGYDVSVKSETSYKAVSDYKDVSNYAKPSINWGYENGFIGNGSNLMPKDKITRTQAATIIARFLRTYRP